MFAEDASAFFADFGVDCVAPTGRAFRALFDAPGQVVTVGGVLVQTESYSVLMTSTDVALGQVIGGCQITVSGTAYRVREVLPEDDGVFMRANLSKL